MDRATPIHIPQVSVIIPCYNQGIFLQGAINSVKVQAYSGIEIIVVDDGSSDNTKEIATKYAGVKYVYQPNQGLSAARNTGIFNSNGELITFLDADDWLLPGAIEMNVHYLQQNEQLAFVSGGHEKVFVNEGITRDDTTEVSADHYLHLLQGNYIGMHATVMYRRRIFNELLYDTTLKACEDYDLYLRIARKYPVYHHTQKIAAYRLHTSNMSANIPQMLTTVLQVLQRQQRNLQTPAEKEAFRKGKRVWKDYYCKELYKKQSFKEVLSSKETFYLIARHQPYLLLKYFLRQNPAMIKRIIKHNIPDFSLKWLHKVGLYKRYIPAIGKVDSGDFNRVDPFSRSFGYDRGGPVDRYYIEKFLKEESGSIQGRVLEIGDNAYTLKFGGKKVTQSDILHVNESNPHATIIGDISKAPHLQDNLFDCIVLTQTLHLIYDFKEAIRTCHRILKPGGTLLLTVPGITPIDHGEWKDTWYWSFTDKAMLRVIDEAFPAIAVEVNSYGNVFTASAFLYGMGISEMNKEKLDHRDPHFQVIVTVKAVKASTQ